MKMTSCVFVCLAFAALTTRTTNCVSTRFLQGLKENPSDARYYNPELITLDLVYIQSGDKNYESYCSEVVQSSLMKMMNQTQYHYPFSRFGVALYNAKRRQCFSDNVVPLSENLITVMSQSSILTATTSGNSEIKDELDSMYMAIWIAATNQNFLWSKDTHREGRKIKKVIVVVGHKFGLIPEIQITDKYPALKGDGNDSCKSRSPSLEQLGDMLQKEGMTLLALVGGEEDISKEKLKGMGVKGAIIVDTPTGKEFDAHVFEGLNFVFPKRLPPSTPNISAVKTSTTKRTESNKKKELTNKSAEDTETPKTTPFNATMMGAITQQETLEGFTSLSNTHEEESTSYIALVSVAGGGGLLAAGAAAYGLLTYFRNRPKKQFSMSVNDDFSGDDHLYITEEEDEETN